MLELKGIKKDYVSGNQTVNALKGVDMQLDSGEFVAVLGPSGCGKTTLLNIVGGLDRYTDGDLIINGTSTKKYKDKDWDSYRNHKVGFVFQTYNLIPHQTVLSNVELALTLSGVSKKERKRRAEAALEKVGLADQVNKKPNQLSGGQMQRVAIARALVNDPEIILADEPTGALDSETSVQVMELLREVAGDKLIIMVTHNAELAERYATRIIRLLDGTVVNDEPNGSAEPLPKKASEGEKEQGKKHVSMSFLTALSLSLNNLMTKKARTILTAFAGSIGIIGIALIFAVSRGMNDYISSVQEDTLSTYPLTIMSETADMATMLASFGEAIGNDETMPEDTIKERQLISRVFAQIGTNDLKSFKLYMEDNMDEIEDCLNAVQYGYNVSPQIYTTDVNGDILQINPSNLFSSAMSGSEMSMMPSYGSTGVFTEMIDNKELLDSQYDVLAGKWPERYDELVLVLSSRNGMSDYLSYSLGLRDQQEIKDMMNEIMNGNEVEELDNPMTWSYNELLSLRFRLIDASSRYKYNSEYDLWEDMSDDEDYMRALVENGEELKIVGIVCPKPGVAASALGLGVCYLPDLTRHVIDRAAETEIVKNQLENTDVDVFSGLTFEELANNEGERLDFNDMISVDTNMLSSAFGVNISEEDITRKMQEYMKDISSSITADTAPATEAFTGALSKMLKDMLSGYIEENADENTGIAMIRAADVDGIINEYLSGEEPQAIMAELSAKYPLPVEMYDQTFSQVLSRILSGYITGVTPRQEDPSAPLTQAAVDAVAEAMTDNPIVGVLFDQVGRGMTEAAMQRDILSEVGEMSADLLSSLSSGFSVDADRIAAAFSFNLSEDELTRLMQTFMSRSEDPSADANLRSLGYSNLDEPYSIAVYLVDFAAKERFIDFIEDYNTKMEDDGNEDLVISYTDITGVLMASVKTVVDSISYVLIAFVAISLIVSSIMIGVITLISVQERTKEIGILRALGASKRNVSSMFNAETAIIGLASGTLGIVITYLLCIPIDKILHKLTGISNLSTHLPIAVALVLILISVMLTLISGIIPSASAAKKDPVVALRTE